MSCGIFRGIDRTDKLPFSENCDAVADLHHLIEFVGDDDDALAVLAHVAHDVEELLRLLRSEHRGGLVQDEDVSPAIEHFYDLDSLLLTHGHVVNLLVQVDVEAVLGCDLARFLPSLSGQPVELRLFEKFDDGQHRGAESEFRPARFGVGGAHRLDGRLRVVVVHDVTRLRRLLFEFRRALLHAVARHLFAEQDVVQRGENIHQLKVLVHHADLIAVSVSRRADDDGLAFDDDLPFIREIDAREHIHKGGLAAAVLAEKGQDLPLIDGEIHILIGNDLSEKLGDALHLHSYGFCHAFLHF